MIYCTFGYFYSFRFELFFFALYCLQFGSCYVSYIYYQFYYYYQSAYPQKDHSYWPKINGIERVLNWNSPINDIKIQIRCFGHIGLIVKLDQELCVTSHVEIIDYKHNLKPGHVAFEDDSLLAVNALDGIVCIHKSSMSAMPM